MARINIEDCWWSDPRRERLAELVGGLVIADGIVIRAWRVAQEFWAKDRLLIPKHIFATIQANASLIQANLAEEREDGIYVRGSSQYLEWCNERRRAARYGGRKSSERPRNALGQLLKKPKQTPSKRQVTSKQIQASGSGSGSGSNSNSNSNSGSVAIAILEKSPPEVNPISFYCDLWKERNGKSPDIRPKEAGQIARLAKDVGLRRGLWR